MTRASRPRCHRRRRNGSGRGADAWAGRVPGAVARHARWPPRERIPAPSPTTTGATERRPTPCHPGRSGTSPPTSSGCSTTGMSSERASSATPWVTARCSHSRSTARTASRPWWRSAPHSEAPRAIYRDILVDVRDVTLREGVDGFRRAFDEADEIPPRPSRAAYGARYDRWFERNRPDDAGVAGRDPRDADPDAPAAEDRRADAGDRRRPTTTSSSSRTTTSGWSVVPDGGGGPPNRPLPDGRRPRTIRARTARVPPRGAPPWLTGNRPSSNGPPVGAARAAGADLLLACSRQNVGYLSDYVYYVGQGLPTILEDGREWSLACVGIPRDPALAAFLTVQTAEEHLVAMADP